MIEDIEFAISKTDPTLTIFFLRIKKMTQEKLEFKTFLKMPEEFQTITDPKVLVERVNAEKSDLVNELFVRRMYELDFFPGDKNIKKWLNERKVHLSFFALFGIEKSKFLYSALKKTLDPRFIGKVPWGKFKYPMSQITDTKVLEKMTKCAVASPMFTNFIIDVNDHFTEKQLSAMFIATNDLELSDKIKSKIDKLKNEQK